MAQLVVRNLEDSVRDRLKRRAKRNGRSMEQEVRDILSNAVNQPESPSGGLGSEIAARFARNGLEFDIPVLRGYTIKPPSFED